jgi:hypothetical protein
MIWKVTRRFGWEVKVKAERFDIVDGALVFFTGTEAVLAFAPDQWASVVPSDEDEDDDDDEGLT